MSMSGCRAMTPAAIAARRVKVLLAALLLPFADSAAQETATLEQVWALTRMLDFNSAEEALPVLGEEAESDYAAIAFARALTLLSLQPRTLDNVKEAYSLLEKVGEAAAGNDFKAWSLYYRGRIDQLHRGERNAAGALRVYRELMEAHPAHLAAQLAFIKTAVIRLYADPEKRSPATNLRWLESQVGFLNTPFVKSLFHALMADGYLFFDLDKERALEHLAAARALGNFEIIDLGADYLRMANIAYELGKRDLALRNYRRFLKMRPKSTSIFLVKERIEELEKGSRVE